MKDHLIFGSDRMSARCKVCGKFTDRPHVIELEKFCAEHCPECHPEPPAERTGEAYGLVGEQVSMWGVEQK